MIGCNPNNEGEMESDRDVPGYIGVQGNVAVEDAGERLGKVR